MAGFEMWRICARSASRSSPRALSRRPRCITIVLQARKFHWCATGFPVNPGDIVVADSDGVAVVPKAQAQPVLSLAQQMGFKEHSHVCGDRTAEIDRRRREEIRPSVVEDCEPENRLLPHI